MKKTGKVKKFAGGGLMDAISRMQSGPSRSEMAQMSIADQIAKMPRGGMDAMSEEMSRVRAPREDFSSMQTKPMRISEDVGMQVAESMPSRMLSRTPSASVSEVSEFMQKPGNSLRAGLESVGQPSSQVAQEAMSRMRRPASLTGGKRLGDRENSAMYKKGGKVSSASSRGDGIATKGKTKGRMI